MINQSSIIGMYSSGTNDNAVTLLRYLSTRQTDDNGLHLTPDSLRGAQEYESELMGQKQEVEA